LNLLALAPEALVAIIILLGLVWFFEDRIAFNKGVPLGAWKLILKTDRLYYEKRCSITDVSHLVLQDPAPVITEIRDELASPYFKELEDEDRFKHIQSTFKRLSNLDDLLHDENFGVQAFVSGSLLASPMLLYVMSRKKDKKTGEPKPFPEGQALVAKRRVLSWSGLIARRLVIGDFILLPKKQRIEGLFRSPVPVGLLVSDEDSNDRELMSHMSKIAPILQDVAAGIRTARQYGIIVKDLSQRLKKALSEQKRLVNRMRTLSGESQADKTTTKWYERGLPNGVKITNSFTPVAMFGFPIFGAAVFQYVLHSNAIFGVIVGGSLAMVLIGTRGT
jgi:hypothetical protein